MKHTFVFFFLKMKNIFLFFFFLNYTWEECTPSLANNEKYTNAHPISNNYLLSHLVPQLFAQILKALKSYSNINKLVT